MVSSWRGRLPETWLFRRVDGLFSGGTVSGAYKFEHGNHRRDGRTRLEFMQAAISTCDFAGT